jgi:hypothetical protein
VRRGIGFEESRGVRERGGEGVRDFGGRWVSNRGWSERGERIAGEGDRGIVERERERETVGVAERLFASELKRKRRGRRRAWFDPRQGGKASAASLALGHARTVFPDGADQLGTADLAETNSHVVRSLVTCE